MSSHISSNPTLAAIQRAKTAQKASLDKAASKAIDVPVASGGSFTGQAVGSPAAKPSALGNAPSVGSPASKGPVNVFGVDDGKGENGWWAKSDAGLLNHTAGGAKAGEQKQAFVPDAAVATMGKSKLDFSSMFGNQGGAAEQPADGTSQWGDFKSS